ncbi:MAG: hypothetical protein H6859_08280 [Rhodospirillales bacterium]|mgnify:CR=1 FL=1|nr:hypothetical protein [Alphaproteobacteria bacterium]USO05142.1 MAG: hypothetical protein H6859_08280 [Rhodospirillales bacterium]
MRFLAIFVSIVLGLAWSVPVSATDEFGARFSTETPSALGGPEAALADIMPAAGEETGNEEDSELIEESPEEDSEENSDESDDSNVDFDFDDEQPEQSDE